MRSLLQQTTLAITAVLVLISCATQTQAIEGRLAGPDNPHSYGRQYMNKVAAASNGQLQLQWFGGGTDDLSFATVKYNNQLGFMKCTFEDEEKMAFDRLEYARDNLKGINVEYRNYVALPVESFKIPEGLAGNCFIYRYIDGIKLEEYIPMRNYADQLISLNRVMPQLLKGSIYLYNAGITHTDLYAKNVMVQGQDPEQLAAFIVDFDSIGLLPNTRTPLVASSLSQGVNPSTTGSYYCNGFNKELFKLIPNEINPNTRMNPQAIVPNDPKIIGQYIQQRTGGVPQLDKVKLQKAINAFTSLRQVATILLSSKDCIGLLAALAAAYGPR